MAANENESFKNQQNARVILQQCLSARLQVKPADENSKAEFVEIGRGLVIYLCFLKGASSDIINKMVKSILNLRLSESDNGKLVSILELPGDVLIIPQATLGGRVKGKMIQYHGNVEKAVGEVLYEEFTKTCQQTVAESRLNDASGILSNVKWGTYGNRQVLTLDTNGPFTHLIEF